LHEDNDSPGRCSRPILCLGLGKYKSVVRRCHGGAAAVWAYRASLSRTPSWLTP